MWFASRDGQERGGETGNTATRALARGVQPCLCNPPKATQFYRPRSPIPLASLLCWVRSGSPSRTGERGSLAANPWEQSLPWRSSGSVGKRRLIEPHLLPPKVPCDRLPIARRDMLPRRRSRSNPCRNDERLGASRPHERTKLMYGREPALRSRAPTEPFHASESFLGGNNRRQSPPRHTGKLRKFPPPRTGARRRPKAQWEGA